MTDSDDEFEPASPDKLYAHHCRQLSAMLDGELAPDQARFMLRRLEHDTELAACWERWQVCGDAMRGQRNTLLPADFAQRVSAAIADGHGQAGAQGGVATPRSRLARWGGGAALAASVAVCALLVARQMPGAAPGALTQDIVAASTSTSTTDPVVHAPDFSTVLASSQGPVEPAPAGGGDAAAALATAVAVAEVPRRAGERRSRGQVQRAARRVQQSRQAEAAQAPAIVLAAATAADAPAVQEPFPTTTQLVAPSRPWPRPVLPGLAAGGTLAAGYALQQPAEDGFDPFRPRLYDLVISQGEHGPGLSDDGGPAPASPGEADGSRDAPH